MHNDTRSLARFAAAAVALGCALIVLAGTPDNAPKVLAIGLLFAALAVLL